MTVSGAWIVHDEAKLKERVEFIHRTTKSTALAEQFIDGCEIYVGVMGKDRISALPAWEFAMTKKSDDKPLIAADRARWDPEYQRQVGLKTGPATLSKKMHAKLADVSKEIYSLLGMSGYARLDYRVTEDDVSAAMPARKRHTRAHSRQCSPPALLADALCLLAELELKKAL